MSFQLPSNVQVVQLPFQVIELPRPLALSEETKKLIKIFTGSGWNNSEKGYLEGFFKLLSGCSDSYLIPGMLRGSSVFQMLFRSLPNYDEKSFKLLEILYKSKTNEMHIKF